MPQIRKRSEQGTYLRAQGWQSRRSKSYLCSKTESTNSGESRHATVVLGVGSDQVGAHGDQTDRTFVTLSTANVTGNKVSGECPVLPDNEADFGPQTRHEVIQDGGEQKTKKNDDDFNPRRSIIQKGQAILALLLDGSFTGGLPLKAPAHQQCFSWVKVGIHPLVLRMSTDEFISGDQQRLAAAFCLHAWVTGTSQLPK